MKISIRFIYTYTIVFFLLYSSGTPVSNNLFPIMRIGLFVLAVFGVFAFSKVADRKTMVYMSVMCVWMLISHLVNWTDGIDTIIGMILIVISSVLFTQIVGRNEFEEAYSNIMCFLAIISLSVVVIQNVMPEVIMTLPTYLGYGIYKNVGFLCFVSLSPLYQMSSAVNASIFREVGVYQFYLLLALCIELCRLKKRRKRIILFIVNMLLIMSTAGIISLFILIIGWSVKAVKDGKIKRCYLVAIFAVIISAGIYANMNHSELFAKFESGSSSNVSLVDRLATIESDLNCIALNPILGLATKATSGSACGITSTAATFGILFVLILIYMMYLYFRKKQSDVIGPIYMFGAVFAGLLTQNLMLLPVVLVFIFYGLET